MSCICSARRSSAKPSSCGDATCACRRVYTPHGSRPGAQGDVGSSPRQDHPTRPPADSVAGSGRRLCARTAGRDPRSNSSGGTCRFASGHVVTGHHQVTDATADSAAEQIVAGLEMAGRRRSRRANAATPARITIGGMRTMLAMPRTTSFRPQPHARGSGGLLVGFVTSAGIRFAGHRRSQPLICTRPAGDPTNRASSQRGTRRC